VRGSCSEVWRGNMAVLTDGSISPCCFDTHGELVVGNIREESLEQVLRGARFGRLLENFARGRLPACCLKCAEISIDSETVRLPKRQIRKPLSAVAAKADSPSENNTKSA